MNKILRIACSATLLLFSLTSLASAKTEWSLLMHIPTSGIAPLTVGQKQQQWLVKKRTLVVGILPTEAPPYGLRNESRQYEGLSADVLGLVANQLGLKVSIKRFDDRDQLWQALASGDVDIIPTVTRFNDPQRVFYSIPYASEQPVLAVRSDDNRPLPLDLADTLVAVSADYLSVADINVAYPKARLQIYDNYQEALSAVAYGNSRVFLGSSYPIGRNMFNNLRVERVAALPEQRVTFALQQKNQNLSTLVNLALQNIPLEKRLEVQQFWQAGTNTTLTQLMQPLNLSASELRWLQDHPTVKVLLYGADNSAPMAFVDREGGVRGVAIDVLGMVAVKTGMKFSFQRGETINGLLDEVNTKQADMIAAIAPSSERLEEVLFSQPYARSAFALITTSDNNSVKQLADLRGKKLALVKQAALTGYISQHYPEIQIVEFNNDDELFGSVLQGKTDAAIGLMMSADYKVNNVYHGKLKIANTVGDFTAYISFGIGKDDPELLSIINKVLIAVPPYELEMIANRWRPNNMVVVDSFWERNRTLLISTAAVSLLVLLLAIARTFWLRRQIQTETRRRRKLSTQVNLLERLIETMPFPIVIRDNEGRLTYCNQLTLDLIAQPYDQIKGRTLQETGNYLSAEVSEIMQQKMQQVRETNSAWHDDILMVFERRKDGRPKSMTASVWLMPWYDTDGHVAGTMMALWDVSDREELVQKLSVATERAEASNRAKSTFLSTMSHEIRTPMNAIIGMLDMAIKQGNKGLLDLEALTVASESAHSLVGLIGDVLDLSRIEGGQLDFNPVRINLGTLISQLLVIFNGLALDKNILLHKHFPDDDIVDVLGDPLRVKQVLSNVLSNAIKFTDYGGVTLTLTQHIDHNSHSVRYHIDVQDSGVGINADQQAALFQPFSQADNRRAGTGLGLYISRSLCEVMGGDLTLSSVVNEGTRVSADITLPLAGIAEPAPAFIDMPQRQSDPLQVLVVDDNSANRILLAKQLAWLGHHAHVAEDAYQALALWKHQRFDVVITDCNMPGMNGYQFTQEIRQQEQHQQEEKQGATPVWIIGFTANAMQETIDRCLAAGMNGCLFKPCSINNLSNALNERPHTTVDANLSLDQVFAADETLRKEFQHRLVISVKEDHADMKRAYQAENWQNLGDLAHRMLGGVRIVDETELAQACEALERACRAMTLSKNAAKNVTENVFEQECHGCWQVLHQEIENWLAKLPDESGL